MYCYINRIFISIPASIGPSGSCCFYTKDHNYFSQCLARPAKRLNQKSPSSAARSALLNLIVPENARRLIGKITKRCAESKDLPLLPLHLPLLLQEVHRQRVLTSLSLILSLV